ncbi:ATP-binding protein [Paenibacillus methanolicus]|uniref:histidine kinase n=1 Tax=Paenibacillus methanolicus TaxID=582686 RepID=A0A5S5BTC4_9BACL|nr:ATP-binding protein [Paenibacillus methanolicus]TYP69452.1 nitrogen-specific signal transduction histidine kinase [Paenibacillus methanolicus]
MNRIPPAPLVRLSMEALDVHINRLRDTMVLVLDERGRITNYNAYFQHRSGYSRQMLMGFGAERIFESQSFEQLVQAGKQPELGGADALPLLMLNRVDGIPMIVTAFVLRAETETGMQLMLVLQEHGERSGVNLLERFGETMLLDEETGVILLRSDSRIMDINQLACQVLNVDAAAALEEPVGKFFEQPGRKFELIRHALSEGVSVRNHPFTWMRGDERREMLMDVGLLKGPSGMAEGAYVIFKDVTNLRSLEQQVQRSDRLSMIGQIAAGAAHEIRNPLTAIRGFLQMFRKTMTDKGMVKEAGYTEIMLTELDRINSLVGEFLLLSKPKNILYDHVDVAQVLQDLLPMISSEALLHNVVVDWEVESRAKPVLADREMLKQVFLNICKNGIEAMANGGILTIKGRCGMEEGRSMVMIEVHDTGDGIPEAMLEKIFDPFVTTKPSGTGLGLSVCQRIVHEFGGTIRALNRKEGALFVITLPCIEGAR